MFIYLYLRDLSIIIIKRRVLLNSVIMAEFPSYGWLKRWSLRAFIKSSPIKMWRNTWNDKMTGSFYTNVHNHVFYSFQMNEFVAGHKVATLCRENDTSMAVLYHHKISSYAGWMGRCSLLVESMLLLLGKRNYKYHPSALI